MLSLRNVFRGYTMRADKQNESHFLNRFINCFWVVLVNVLLKLVKITNVLEISLSINKIVLINITTGSIVIKIILNLKNAVFYSIPKAKVLLQLQSIWLCLLETVSIVITNIWKQYKQKQAPKVFYKKNVFKIFAIFTGIRLCWVSFY